MAAALFHALTTSAGQQAVWELLNDFRECGPIALAERREAARASKWGPVRFDTFAAMPAGKIREIEDSFLPAEHQRDYEHTFGHFQFPI